MNQAESTHRGPAVIVSADWSKESSKRSVHVADTEERRIWPEERPDWSLGSLLAFSRTLAARGPVLVGLDLVLGVPEAYWNRAIEDPRWADQASFVDWVATLDRLPSFFEIANSPDEWRVDRPFFRVPAGKGGLGSVQARAGSSLRRRIDECTGANPIFAVSGIPGTVGSGTRALWQELAPLLTEDRDFAVWPFEGELEELLRSGRVVLAETYPGMAYAAAIAPSLPTNRILISKTKQPSREQACELLAEAAWVREGSVELGDLEGPRSDEDSFDSHMTAAAVLRCVMEGRSLDSHEWIDAVAEGSMLLAGPVNLKARGRRLTPSTHETNQQDRGD